MKLKRFLCWLRTFAMLLLLIQAGNASLNAAVGGVLVVDTERVGVKNRSVQLIQGALVELGLEKPKVVHHSKINVAIKEEKPAAVILSGQVSLWRDYKTSELKEVTDFIKSTRIPILGICGGHQLIAIAFGGSVEPVARHRNSPTYRKGWLPVALDTGHPLFSGVGGRGRFWFNHREEVKEPPMGFRSLSRGENGGCDAMGNSRAIFGVQFHPEVPGSTSGRIVLTNFLRLSGIKGVAPRRR